MDILIKGLALPKKGTTELTIYDDGHVLYEQDDGQYIEMGDATAIELPPHGRLVDADALLIEGITDYNGEGHTVVEYYEIQDAPTVVEATEIHTAPPAPIKREHCRYYAFSATAICGEHEYCLKKETYNFECSKECPYRELVVEASK